MPWFYVLAAVVCFIQKGKTLKTKYEIVQVRDHGKRIVVKESG